MRKAPYRPERIVFDSIERSVGYGAICEEMSSLSLLLRSFSRLGRDSAELMAHFTTLSPSWDILLSLKRVFLSWDKWNCLLIFELLRILFTLYDTSSVASILLSCLPLDLRASYPWFKALVEKDFSLLAVPSTCLPSLLVPFIPYCNCKSSVDYLAKHPSSKYSTGILLVENGLLRGLSSNITCSSRAWVISNSWERNLPPKLVGLEHHLSYLSSCLNSPLGPRRDRVEREDLISAPSACPFLTLSMGTTHCPSFLWWNLGFTLPEVIIAKTKKDIWNLPQESNYNSLRLIWRRGLRSPLFRRLSAGWGMHRSAMSLDLLASLSRPNVIREDLPKHHLVIIKINIQYNHRKEYLKKNRNVSGSYAWNSRTISAIQKKRSISLSLSVFPLPSFRNKPFA
ncbi:hypothetical protein VNO77_46172 [Canavalia gladiata]|uniref:Uncharacterized protein n=1 Tax=Canavalia gladiata TaxID=3824 RepID=A0AAN9PJ50_CANGL